MKTTDTLRKLLGQATKGPWRFAPDERNEYGGDDDERFVGTINGRDHRSEWHIASVESDGPRPTADASLIAAAVNALPALIEIAEKARESLRDHEGCDYGPVSCSGCRLDAALAKLEKETPCAE